MAGRIQNLKPWRKGVSGNPGGRPKRKPIEEELLRLIDERVSPRDKRTHARKIAEAMLRAAGNGNVNAFMAVADRVDGRVPLAEESSDARGQTIEIIIQDMANTRLPLPGKEQSYDDLARRPSGERPNFGTSFAESRALKEKADG